MRASAESSHRLPFIVARRHGAYVGGHHGISPTSSAGSGSSEGVEKRKRRGGVARLRGAPHNRSGTMATGLDRLLILSTFIKALRAVYVCYNVN